MKARHLGGTCIGAVFALAWAGAAQAQFFSHFETTNLPGNTARQGASTLTFIPGSGLHRVASSAGAEVVLANFIVDSSQPDSSPDDLILPFEITVNLVDEASGESTAAKQPPIVFAGTLQGAASRRGAHITSASGSPQTFDVMLGKARYVVTLGQFNAPTAENDGLGSITATVKSAAVPEPGTLSMLGSALPLLGLIRRRRK